MATWKQLPVGSPERTEALRQHYAQQKATEDALVDALTPFLAEVMPSAEDDPRRAMTVRQALEEG